MTSTNAPPDGHLRDAPLLKAGVLHAQVEDGTYIELGERSFLVRGERLFPIVSRILACFDGERPAHLIRASLPEKLMPVFDQVFDRLAHHRMLTSGPRHAIPADHPHASTLAFFREATSRWREAFKAWTVARIALAGSRELLPVLARALASAGAGHVSIVDLDAAEAASTGDGRDAPSPEWPPGCERLDRAAALRMEKTPRSLLLYAALDAPQEDAFADIEALSRSHEVVIVGAVRGGLGIVGPDCRAGLTPWRSLMAKTPDAGPPFTRAALRVLASLLAFEAMQERIAAWSDDPEEYGLRASRFRMVRNDGSVDSHDVDVFLASGRRLGDAVEETSPVAHVDPQTTRFFDPATGPFRDASVPGPEYPLAHRAVALTFPQAQGEVGDETLWAWGIDPAAAEQRLMLDAFATLMTHLAGHVPGPGVSPLVAAGSEEDARAQAAAFAIATAPDFFLAHPPRAHDLSSDERADAQGLLRLIHLYCGALPVVRKSGGAEVGACVVWASIGDDIAVAVAPDFDAALLEALGESLSAFQLGRPSVRQTRWPQDRMRALPTSGAPAQTTAAFAPVVCDYVEADAPWLPPGIRIGHARVRDA